MTKAMNRNRNGKNIETKAKKETKMFDADQQKY